MGRPVDRRQVVAHRLHRHGLGTERADDLRAAVPLGMQDTAHGAVPQALAMRLDDVDGTTVSALVADGTLVPTYGPRLAATLVHVDDLPLVTGALLDPDPAADQMFERLAEELAEAALPLTRERGPLTKEQLGEALLPHVPDAARYDCPRCERVHVHDALVKHLAWTNRLRLEPDERKGELVAPAARWRPRRFRLPRDEERAEMVRRAVRLHGPTTADGVAALTGTTEAHARRCWALVEGELAQVDGPSGPGWVLAEDLDALVAPPEPPAARLVPPYDPLLSTRDRASLVGDRDDQRLVWRSTANPGVVVVDGVVVGTWRGRLRSDHYEITVERFRPGPDLRDLVEQDAARLATSRGRDQVELLTGR